MEMQMQTPPRTIMEVFRSLPEGTLAELIDNVIYMSPSPLTNHQIISADLASDIHVYLRKKGNGMALTAPMDVYLDETSNAIQPDIIVILKDQLNIIRNKGHIHGIPAILIEILSEGNKDHDLIRKKELYQRFGVQEYHIVDPDTKFVMSFSLDEGRYRLTHEAIGNLQSDLLQQTFPF